MTSFWNRRLTILVLASAQSAPWRLSVSLPLILLAAAAAGALGLLGTRQAARELDGRLVRAENRDLRSRLASLAEEMSRSRKELEAGRQAEKELRALLHLPVPQEALRARQRDDLSASGAGGPERAERDALLRSLLEEGGPGLPETVKGHLEDMRRISRERVAGLRELSRSLARRRRLLELMPLGAPAPGRLTSPFGRRPSPMRSRASEFHPGLDIANAAGVPVRATAAGIVVRARWAGGYGRVVVIRHPLGYSTLYGHARRLLVREGQRVRRGQVIATMGSSGRSTGSHLHYEVWWNGRPRDPVAYGARLAGNRLAPL